MSDRSVAVLSSEFDFGASKKTKKLPRLGDLSQPVVLQELTVLSLSKVIWDDLFNVPEVSYMASTGVNFESGMRH